MKRMVLGSLVGCLLLGGLASTLATRVEASKPFTKVTKIECSGCHTSKKEEDMTDKDLNDCGKASAKVLKEKGYTRPKSEAQKLKEATRILKGFKCPS